MRLIERTFRLGLAYAFALVAGIAALMIRRVRETVAHHRGVWSLGLLLVIGSATTLIASLVVLPTLVRLGGERRRYPVEHSPVVATAVTSIAS